MRKAALQSNLSCELVPCPPEHLECYMAGISAWWRRIERAKIQAGGMPSAAVRNINSSKENPEVPKFTVFCSLSKTDENSSGLGGETMSHNTSLCDMNDQEPGQNGVNLGDYQADFMSHNSVISGGYVKNGAQKPIF